jgi:hypothetical protein
VERAVRLDVRRFVFYKWRIVEVPVSIPLDPVRIWRERYGFLPPLGMGGVVGAHFRVADGVRAVEIFRPEPLQVPHPVLSRLFAAVGAKHRVAQVRLARSGESPNLRAADRLPQPRDRERIEEWPTDDDKGRDSLVAELPMPPGRFLAAAWPNVTDSLDEAAEFASVQEAEAHLEGLSPQPHVILRYRAACQAEADERDAAAIDGKAVLY